jgi:hypothetical protein
MLRKLALSALFAAVLGVLAAPGYAATEVFTHEWNFDASDIGVNPVIYKIGAPLSIANKTVWTAGPDTHLPSGTQVNLLGPFGNDNNNAPLVNQASGVHTTVGTSGDTYNAVTITFQLWIINTWDGDDNSAGLGPDFFQVGVVGGDSVGTPTLCDSTSVLCETFQNGAGSQSFPDAPFYSGYLGGGGSFNPGFGDVAYDGYSIFTITLTEVPVSPIDGKLTVYFRGWQNQQSYDESWAISNLKITALQVENGGPGPGPEPVPEPSTMLLGGLGLAFIAIASKRLRKN